MLLKQRITSLLFVFLILSHHLPAEDSGQIALFINSNPINAGILLDGEPVLQKTPALIKNLNRGTHSIGIRKDGFSPVDFNISLEEGDVLVSETELLKNTFIISFPDNKNGIMYNNGENGGSQNLRLDEGGYSFSKQGGTLRIDPVYPKEQILTAAGTLFLTALALNIASAGVELYQYGELFFPHSTRLVVTETLASVLGLSELALLIDRRSYLDKFEFFEADLDTLDSDAEHLFNSAQKALSSGRIEEALSGFSELIGNYPDFSGFPEALYKVSRLHIISGDTNLAISELNIVINQFPDAEFYDKACQTLSLMYHNSGDIQKSRAAAEQMVFYDPIFEQAKIDMEKKGVDGLIESWAGNPARPAE